MQGGDFKITGRRKDFSAKSNTEINVKSKKAKA
jgi:hypothetical protein